MIVRRVDHIRSSIIHRTREAFTLIELLMVVTVIGIITAMLSVAMASSQQQALTRRCQGELLNYGLLLQNLSSGITFTNFRYVEGRGAGPRAAPTGLGIITSGPNQTPLTQIQADDEARMRLLLARDFARMMMPQCQADLHMPPVSVQKRIIDAGQMRAVTRSNLVPPIWDEMRRLAGLRDSKQIDAASKSNSSVSREPIADANVDAVGLFYSNATFRDICTTSINPVKASTPWTAQFESAECLYLIFATMRRNGKTVVDNIPKRNIGDLDGDGFNELLDPWGVPLCFIREPAGLQGRGLPNYDPTVSPVYKAYEAMGSTAEKDSAFPSDDPDPFDLLGADYRFLTSSGSNYGGNAVINAGSTPVHAFYPYYLPPVVISAGSDGEFGIYRAEDLNPAAVGSAPNPFLHRGSYSFTLDTPPGPRYPQGSGFMPYRYPDPYFDVNLVGSPVISSSPGTAAFGQIVNARRGTGLGGIRGTRVFSAAPTSAELAIIEENLAFSDDNITSLDGAL